MKPTDDKLRKIMGLKFKYLRKRKDLNQDEVAFLMGLTRVSICNIEAGKQSLIPSNILKASIVFECSILDFFPSREEYCPVIESATVFEERQLKNKIEKLEAKLTLLKSNK